MKHQNCSLMRSCANAFSVERVLTRVTQERSVVRKRSTALHARRNFVCAVLVHHRRVAREGYALAAHRAAHARVARALVAGLRLHALVGQSALAQVGTRAFLDLALCVQPHCDRKEHRYWDLAVHAHVAYFPVVFVRHQNCSIPLNSHT
jgi:hypothetical protein